MIELGNKIYLEGFDSLDIAKLIVIKKIVGNYVRSLENAGELVKSLNLALEIDDNIFKITGKLDQNQEKNAEAKDTNLFYSLNSVLTKLSN